MALKEIFPGVHQLALGAVNSWLIKDDQGLTVIDTGYAGDEVKIVAAAQTLGAKITRIVLTHAHPDHAGGLAKLMAATGAPAWAGWLEADQLRHDRSPIAGTPSAGLMNRLLYRMLIAGNLGWHTQANVTHDVRDGDVLAVGGGLRALHTPGHSIGHMAYLLARDGGLLFAGDTCSNMPSLGPSIVYEDHAEARATLRRLAALSPRAACFGHGGVLHDWPRFARRWGG